MSIFDANVIQLVYGLFAAVIAAAVYSIILEFKNDPNLSNPVDWPMVYSNVIFGIAIGVVAWVTGTTVTIDWLGGQIAAYGVLIFLLDHIITGIINRTIAKPQFVFYKKDGTLLKNLAPATDRKSFLAGLVADIRKMDPASRDYLVFDLPVWAQQPTLNDVDQA